MDKKMLQETFREYKKATATSGHKIAYAITNPDSLGDCQSCVNYALCEKYGEESKGVWVKHWTRGMNNDYPLDSKTRDGKDRIDHVYIAHDLDEVQVALFYQVVGEHYNILPKQEDFSSWKCFCLYEKGLSVWEVYYDGYNRDGKVVTRAGADEYTDIEAAMCRAKFLLERPETVTKVSIEKIF